ncbi:MAG: sensor histidine kinase [Opitutales bacterium]
MSLEAVDTFSGIIDGSATKTLLQAFPAPVFVADAQGQTSFRNSRGEWFLRAPEIDEELPSDLRTIVEEVLRTQEGFYCDSFDRMTFWRVDGEERFFFPQVLPFESPASSESLALVVLHEVTALRLAEELRRDLIATVSHELKTPLTAARMSVYLLLEQMRMQIDSDQLELVMTARKELDRLLHSLESLLLMASLKAGKQSLAFEDTPVSAILKAAVDSVEGAAQARQIPLKMTPPEMDAEVRADRVQVQTVLERFVRYALQEGSCDCRIEVSARPDDGVVWFTVARTGEVLPLELTGRLFEAAPDNANPANGQVESNLGLFLARETVRAHGGKVGLRTLDGEGTEIFFSLPRSSLRQP